MNVNVNIINGWKIGVAFAIKLLRVILLAIQCSHSPVPNTCIVKPLMKCYNLKPHNTPHNTPIMGFSEISIQL
jgi:hypothetical protein